MGPGLEQQYDPGHLLGDRRFDHLLEDISPEALDWYAADLRQIVDEASGLDSSDFDHQQHLTREMLISEATNALTLLETRIMVASCDPLIGPVTEMLMYVGQTTAQDGSQADALYERYRQVPRFLIQALALHLEEVAAGRTPIAANVRRVLSQIDDYLRSPLETDPYASLRGPEGWEGLEAWRERMRTLAADEIRPAFARYREGVAERIPISRDEEHSGLCHIAGGDDIYARMIERFTTLPYSAQDLHDIGQSQARGVHADEFREIGQGVFGTTDLAVILIGFGTIDLCGTTRPRRSCSTPRRSSAGHGRPPRRGSISGRSAPVPSRRCRRFWPRMLLPPTTTHLQPTGHGGGPTSSTPMSRPNGSAMRRKRWRFTKPIPAIISS